MKSQSRQLPARSRQAAKRDAVAADLRRAIIAGKYAPGRQLPPHLVLAKRFGVSVLTVQMGLTRLVREGFVEARPRSGTFVAQNLPHLTNYALVFWNDPVAPTTWSRYYMALTNAAIAIERETERKILLFHRIDEHVDSEDRERLLAMMRASRLAGMIFVNRPTQLVGTPLLEEPGIPRVALMDRQYHPNVTAVSYGDFVGRALDYLCARGRKRIAIVNIETDEGQDQALARRLASRGLAAPTYWRQGLSRLRPFNARHCVELLLRGPAADRPDGLIIMDDNLVEPGLAGIVAAGVKVPDELEVVTHCNFPWPTSSVLPVKRLGIDTHAVLRRCVELIDRQRRGEPVPGVTKMPVVFEDERMGTETLIPAAAPQPAVMKV